MPLVIEEDLFGSTEKRGIRVALNRFLPLLAIPLLSCGGCATFYASADSTDGSGRGPASMQERQPASYINEGSGLAKDSELEKRIAESDLLLSEDEEEAANDELPIPIEINNRVAAWINHFTVRDRERTIRYFQRGSAYKAQLEKLLEQGNVPKELFYLAMIESGFVQAAKSHAEAVGIWQMIPGTAKNYGLKVNQYVDERRNWIKSTEAAITYLKDLRNVFGSWYLAFAAYNAGEYRIVRSIMAGKTRDFWTLAEGNMLPVETLNYVPKFMAAMIIGKNPEKYGITFEPETAWGEFSVVEVPSGTKFKDLARVTGISADKFKEWNPDILKGVIPFDRSGRFEICLPQEEIAKFEAKKDAVASLKRASMGSMAMNDAASNYAIYVVKHGDTLSSVSRTLGSSVRTLKSLNRMSKTRLHAGQRIRYLTVSTGEEAKTKIHVVKKNETIHSIAHKHRVTAEQIAAANNLKELVVFPGQKLRIPVSYAARDEGLRGPGSSGTGGAYIVRRGDTLAKIAERYNTSVKRLKQINGLHKNKLRTGQELRIN